MQESGSSQSSDQCTADQRAAGLCGSSGGGTDVPQVVTPPTPHITNSPEQGGQPGEQSSAEVQARQENARYEESAPQTEFQRLVTLSVGRRLPVFGRDLFRNAPNTFTPAVNMPIPGEYMIDAGDELMLRGWGQVDINYRATVDPSGNIYVPQVGQIHVGGVKYSDLTPVVKSSMSRVFHNFELVVTVARTRALTIYVVGQARHPGAFTVTALSTAFNALFATGGPLPGGSLRNIEIRRDNRPLTTIDLYDFILRGDKSHDVTLKSGDVMYIPQSGGQAAVAGSVNNPAIYELKADTTLDDLLKMAGGLATTAAGQRVLVERIDNKTVRQVDEFMLDGPGLKHPVKDGDLVTVLPVSSRFENAVTLRGNVAVPARYPWHQGMRIHDLIPNRETLITDAYWLKQNSSVMRDRESMPYGEPETSAPNQINNASRNQQQTQAQAQQQQLSAQQTMVQDSARQPVTQAGVQRASGPTHDEAQLHTEIKRNAPDINWDYAVVQRLNQKELTSELIPFNLRQALDEPNSASDLVLQPGDVVTIFSQADMQVPFDRQSKYIRLEGEVEQAGVYKVQPGETLRQLVQRAGGLSPRAYLYGSVFTRESTRIEQQKKMDEALDRLSVEVERSASVTAQNLSSPQEGAGLGTRIDSQRRLVENLRKVRATGRIVLDVKPYQTTVDKLPALELEDGDRLIVPHAPSTVTVIGAVYNENDFIYRPGQRVRDYLRRSGGLTRSADNARIYVVRADGSVEGRHNGAGWLSASFENLRLNPGDSIVVPEKLDKTKFSTLLKDYSQIFSQLALGATAIRVLQ